MISAPYEVHEPPELIERLRAIADGIEGAIAAHRLELRQCARDSDCVECRAMVPACPPHGLPFSACWRG